MSKRRDNSKTRKIAAQLEREPHKRICPGCGRIPDHAQHTFCPYCGDKFIERSELPNDIWTDPAVKERLKEGWTPDTIMVLRCPECSRWGYYNQGGSFSCRFCDVCFVCLSQDESKPEGRPSLRLDESDCVTLADTVTETTDGYNNETR